MTTFHIENHVANVQTTNNAVTDHGYTILRTAGGWAVFHTAMNEAIATFNELQFAKEAVEAFKRGQNH